MRIRRSTAERYAQALAHWICDLGEVFVDAITPVDVEDCMAGFVQVGHAPETINGWLRVLKSCLKDACLEAGLPHLVAGVRPLPEHRKEHETLTPSELGQLLDHVRETEPHQLALLLVLSLTGMRWGEATALRWEDLDGGVIRVRRAHYRGELGPTKTGRSRVVPMVPELADALQEHRRRLLEEQDPGLEAGWCFASTNQAGEVVLRAPSTWAKALPRWLEACDIDKHITPKRLRNGMADLLRAARVDPYTRQQLLGHGERVHGSYQTIGVEEAGEGLGRVVELVRGGER